MNIFLQKRLERRWTQKHLEEISGVSHHQISKLERGIINPKNMSVFNACALAHAFERPVEELFCPDTNFDELERKKQGGG